MNYEVIGVRRSAGTSKKTGKPYSGYIVFYTYRQADVTGVASDNAFVSDQLLEDYIPQVGDKIQLIYDRNGFLQAFELVA